jgi:hypothetical protein
LGSVLLVGAGATLGFEYVDVNQSNGPLTVETISGPLKLETTVDKTVYNLGETVNITITLINISNETVTLCFSSPREFMITVYNESFKPIYNSHAAVAFATVGYDVHLQPNEYRGIMHYWEQGEVWEETLKLGTFKQVKPGTYFIVGETGDSLGWVEPYGIKKVETPQIQIEIIDIV